MVFDNLLLWHTVWRVEPLLYRNLRNQLLLRIETYNLNKTNVNIYYNGHNNYNDYRNDGDDDDEDVDDAVEHYYDYYDYDDDGDDHNDEFDYYNEL